MYHFLAFTKLRSEDIVHHLLFVGVFGAVNFLMEWGRVVNCILFFVTGLPGGIDYALLALVKLGKYDKLDEKRANARINTWLRCPGLVAVAVLMSVCGAHGVLRVPYIALAIVIVLVSGNGIYYSHQVHANYHSLNATKTGGRPLDHLITTPQQQRSYNEAAAAAQEEAAGGKKKKAT